MDIVGALLPYGPVGIAFGALLYYLNQTHNDLRLERTKRIEDAEKNMALILALQERMLTAVEKLSVATEIVMSKDD